MLLSFLPAVVALFTITSEMAAVYSTVAETAEPLPLYVQDQLPQNSFDMLLTRIALPVSAIYRTSAIYPEARAVLESFVESRRPPAYNGPEKHPSRDPIDHYPHDEPGSVTGILMRVKQQIVKELFNAIQREDEEAIALLIQHNLVTANTTSEIGQTPLLEAISTKNITIVKAFLDFGADCNKFGVVNSNLGQATRTPLMLAAGLGSLPIVKLLFNPPYSANDALVAPDGQIALRLAAENGHRAIVDYLPSCRAGGYLRFKTHNARSIQRIKNALSQIGTIIKFFVWHLPKFFVWDAPKHLVVLPIVRSSKWCWKNRQKIGLWCKHQLKEMPKRVARFGKAIWKITKKIPKAVWRAAKKVSEAVWNVVKKAPGVVWNAAKKTPMAIWNAIKEVSEAVWLIGKALWRFLTVKIPNAILIALKWTWEGISSLARAIGNIFLRVVSFLHAVFEAIITFLRTVTLRDIWNAFCDFLRAVFVTFPQTLWTWIQRFGDASFRFMKTLLGSLGELLWWIVYLLVDAAVYIPKRLGIILLTIGGSIVKAFSEIRVWISPKA